jgi:hypothetical protein
VLFQPAAFGGGVTEGVITGGVRSIFKLTELEAENCRVYWMSGAWPQASATAVNTSTKVGHRGE